MNLHARIARMERREAEEAPPCPQCCNYPFLMLFERPGKTKPEMLPADQTRLTDDYHCRRCGRPAKLAVLDCRSGYSDPAANWSLP